MIVKYFYQLFSGCFYSFFLFLLIFLSFLVIWWLSLVLFLNFFLFYCVYTHYRFFVCGYHEVYNNYNYNYIYTYKYWLFWWSLNFEYILTTLHVYFSATFNVSDIIFYIFLFCICLNNFLWIQMNLLLLF